MDRLLTDRETELLSAGLTALRGKLDRKLDVIDAIDNLTAILADNAIVAVGDAPAFSHPHEVVSEIGTRGWDEFKAGLYTPRRVEAPSAIASDAQVDFLL